jgi:CRP-like cAMP-binding protein
MPDLPNVLDRMIRKFERRAKLSDPDREALVNLPHRMVKAEPGRYIVREGSSTDHSGLIVSGLAYRHKISSDGSRQIVSLQVPGDFIDLEGALLKVADHNVQALTRCDLAMIPSAALRELLVTHPQVALAMWVDTLIDASIFREWIINIGRRDARARLAHIFCEFARRLEVAGIGSTDGYELPMTQEQLARRIGADRRSRQSNVEVLGERGADPTRAALRLHPRLGEVADSRRIFGALSPSRPGRCLIG